MFVINHSNNIYLQNLSEVSLQDFFQFFVCARKSYILLLTRFKKYYRNIFWFACQLVYSFSRRFLKMMHKHIETIKCIYSKFLDSITVLWSEHCSINSTVLSYVSHISETNKFKQHFSLRIVFLPQEKMKMVPVPRTNEKKLAF